MSPLIALPGLQVLLTSSGAAKLGDVGLARLQTRTTLSDLPLIGTYAWCVAGVVGSGGEEGGRQEASPQSCGMAGNRMGLGALTWLPRLAAGLPVLPSRVAPEVLMGGQNCTSAVDIFSFGGAAPCNGAVCSRALPPVLLRCRWCLPQLRCLWLFLPQWCFGRL